MSRWPEGRQERMGGEGRREGKERSDQKRWRARDTDMVFVSEVALPWPQSLMTESTALQSDFWRGDSTGSLQGVW